MNQVAEKAKNFGQRIVLYFKRYALITFQWAIKVAKVQQQKLLQKKAIKKLEKAFSEFGAEVYKEFVQGNANWQDVPAVKEKLDNVKLAEADVEQFNQRIEEINRQFEDKKNEIKEKFASMERSVEEEKTESMVETPAENQDSPEPASETTSQE